MCNPLCCKCCRFGFVVAAVACIALNVWMMVEHGYDGLPTVPLVESIIGTLCGLYTISLGACHHYIETIRQAKWKLNFVRVYSLCGSALIIGAFTCTIIATISMVNDCAACEQQDASVLSYVCDEFCVYEHDFVFMIVVALLPIQFVYSMAIFAYTCCCVCTYGTLRKNRRKLETSGATCSYPQPQDLPLLECPVRQNVEDYTCTKETLKKNKVEDQ